MNALLQVNGADYSLTDINENNALGLSKGEVQNMLEAKYRSDGLPVPDRKIMLGGRKKKRTKRQKIKMSRKFKK